MAKRAEFSQRKQLISSTGQGIQVGEALAENGEIAFSVNQKTPAFKVAAVGGRQLGQRLTEAGFKGDAVVADGPERRFDAFQHGKKGFEVELSGFQTLSC